MADQIRIKMSASYGQLRKGKDYKVDKSTGENLIKMGLAKEHVRKAKKAKA